MDEISEATGTPAPQEGAPAASPQPETLRGDPESFRQRHPGMEMSDLEDNPVFRRFCGTRLYREDAAQLYADYLDFSAAAMHNADTRAADRSARSTGGGGGHADNGLSPEQRKSLDEWNRAYPAMRMTAREFLERG